MSSTDDEYKLDREVCQAATPGPWLKREYPDCYPLIKMSGPPADEIQDITRPEDAAFIARSRTRWPAALDRIAELERELVMLRPDSPTEVQP